MNLLAKLKLIERVLRTPDDRMGTSSKAILADLICYMNDKCQCWPSDWRLASHLGTSERTVRRHIAFLDAAGIIKREIRPGRNRTNMLTVNVDAIDKLPEEKRSPVSGFSAEDELLNGQENRTLNAPKTGHQRPPNLIRESIREGERADNVQYGNTEQAGKPEQALARPPVHSPEEETGGVDLIRQALFKITGRRLKPGDDLPKELADIGAEYGLPAEWLGVAIRDIGARRRRNRIESNGFFLKALPEELPDWIERNTYRIDLWRHEEKHARMMATAVPIEEAAEYLAEQSCEVDEGLRHRLRREGVASITPEQLEARVHQWQEEKCRMCRNTGFTGSRVKRTFAFCDCIRGRDLRADYGTEYCFHEIENAHTNIKTLLAVALREHGETRAADAVKQSDVTESEGRITLKCDPKLESTLNDEDLRPSLMDIGRGDVTLIVNQIRTPPPCLRCDTMGHYREDGRSVRCSCEWGARLDPRVLKVFNRSSSARGKRQPVVKRGRGDNRHIVRNQPNAEERRGPSREGSGSCEAVGAR